VPGTRAVPHTPENSYYISKTRCTEPLCSWTGRSSITQEHLTQFGIRRTTGSVTGKSAAGTGRSDLRGPSRSRRLFASDDRPRLLASELASVAMARPRRPSFTLGSTKSHARASGLVTRCSLQPSYGGALGVGCAALASERLSFCNFWISSARVRAPGLTAAPASSIPHRRMRETERVRDQLIRVATCGEVVDLCLVNIADSPSHCANGCNRHVP